MPNRTGRPVPEDRDAPGTKPQHPVTQSLRVARAEYLRAELALARAEGAADLLLTDLAATPRRRILLRRRLRPVALDAATNSARLRRNLSVARSELAAATMAAAWHLEQP